MHSVISSGLGSLECFVITKCTKFGQLILRKIITIVATRCQILRLKCTKFDFGWGSAPDPAGGAYSALPDPLVGFKGPTSKEREGKWGESVPLALILQSDHWWCPSLPKCNHNETWYRLPSKCYAFFRGPCATFHQISINQSNLLVKHTEVW